MAIQELDIRIYHHAGKHNSNADTLSRSPLLQPPDAGGEDVGVVAAVGHDLPEEAALSEIITFLETGVLPEDNKLTSITQSQYTLEEGILYRVEPDGSLRVIPPEKRREELFRTAHAGAFGAHLRDAKVFSELRHHFWWPGMCTDVTPWSRGCLTFATYSTGKAVYPPLTPIPVSGPFDRIGVDVILFPEVKLRESVCCSLCRLSDQMARSISRPRPDSCYHCHTSRGRDCQ